MTRKKPETQVFAAMEENTEKTLNSGFRRMCNYLKLLVSAGYAKNTEKT